MTGPLLFPLAARVNGRDLLFVGTDVVTGLFFAGFPDDMPLTKCWSKGSSEERAARIREQESWHDWILTRAVGVKNGESWRHLTPELVQRLGAARDELVLGYFSAVGWIASDDKHYRDCDLPMPADVRFESADSTPESRRAMTRIPGKNVLWVVKEIAHRSGTSAHRVWRSWMVSEFIWSWRVTLEPEFKKNQESKALAGLPPEMAAIGVG